MSTRQWTMRHRDALLYFCQPKYIPIRNSPKHTNINNRTKRNARRGSFGHNFNLRHSLELDFYFPELFLGGLSHLFGFGIWDRIGPTFLIFHGSYLRDASLAPSVSKMAQLNHARCAVSKGCSAFKILLVLLAVAINILVHMSNRNE